jgi:outer membrane protein OmpA-like peptidoglycan-associated protein
MSWRSRAQNEFPEAYLVLHVQVEGRGANVGGVEFNQRLSEQRSNSVRDFPVKQGVRPEIIGSRGLE